MSGAPRRPESKSQNPLARLIRWFFLEPWREIDSRRQEEPGSYDWWPGIVLMTVAVAITVQEYVGGKDVFFETFEGGGKYRVLASYGWWSAWRFIGYVVIPVVVIAAMPGQKIRDYYLGIRGFHRHLWIYVAMFLLILPAVFIASRTDSFRLTYPFYKLSNRSVYEFLVWELMYAVQFLSLEFFFRGFMLRGLEARLGSNAVFVMIVPYCMIHFGKPMSETLGAVGAGIILGTMAMRTRSIWGGVALHVAVALTMDFLALSQCPPMSSGLYCPGH